MTKIKMQAFTLIELIVTLLIAGVLLSMAFPSFQSLMAKSELTTVTNSMIGAINYARSEAINRGVTVILEPLGGGGGWHVVAGAEELKRFNPSTKQITIDAGGATSINYQATGYRQFGQPAVVLTVCNNHSSTGKTITVSGIGGVIVADVASC